VGCLWHLQRGGAWCQACLCPWDWDPFPGPRGLGTEQPSMLARIQSIWSCSRRPYQHGLVQTLPDAIGIPVTQAPPAGHTTAVTQGLKQVFPWDACLQHEQNAIERYLIAHGELTCTTFDGRHEGWDQVLQLSQQFFANGLSCHEGQKHKCFWLISKRSGVSGSY